MLNGWKAIAAYLGREERTAMRWAADRNLPVHRAPGPGRGSVYALAQEVDAWLRDARVPAEPEPARAATQPAPVTRPRRWVLPAVAAAMLALLATVVLMRPAMRADRQGEATIADPAAKAAYLRASYDWSLRTRDSLQRAVREYGEAIERDPRAAPAYAGLANCYLLLREFGSMPDAQAYPRARAAAQAAAALDPRSVAAHRALAFVAFWWDRDRALARREFAQALAAAPDDALTHHWFATALAANGEREAALREIDRARDLAPGDTAIVADGGLIAYLAGRRAEGLATLRGLEADQPQAVGPHRALADFALLEGRTAEFLAEATTTARLRGDDATLTALSSVRSNGATIAAVERVLLGRARDAAAGGGGWYDVARYAALAGDAGQAGDALSRACRAGEPATAAASGDLFVLRSLDAARVRALCGGAPMAL